MRPRPAAAPGSLRGAGGRAALPASLAAGGGRAVRPFVVANRLFGPHVTVTGLLGGAEVPRRCARIHSPTASGCSHLASSCRSISAARSTTSARTSLRRLRRPSCPRRNAWPRRLLDCPVSGVPIVVVVGSPNAGKSTLVNRLSGSRSAVVHETPGVTRDRKESRWSGPRRRLLLMVDTGGFDTAEDAPFAGHPRTGRLALAEADVVLFLVDGRAGPLGDDFAIADELRRLRALRVVANKLDDPACTSPRPRSCTSSAWANRCSSPRCTAWAPADLLDRPVDVPAEAHVARTRGRCRAEIPVAIVGRPNAGKSTPVQRDRRRTAGARRRCRGHHARRHRHERRRPTRARFRFVDTAGMRKAPRSAGSSTTPTCAACRASTGPRRRDRRATPPWG